MAVAAAAAVLMSMVVVVGETKRHGGGGGGLVLTFHVSHHLRDRPAKQTSLDEYLYRINKRKKKKKKVWLNFF